MGGSLVGEEVADVIENNLPKFWLRVFTVVSSHCSFLLDALVVAFSSRTNGLAPHR